MTHVPGADPFGRPARPENNLGIAGLICSVVGIMSCGLLSPIGLILSLIALKREPKGLAIAGAIIGAVGSCGIIVGVLLFFGTIAMVLTAIGFGGLAIALGGDTIEAKVEMSQIVREIDVYSGRTGQLPAALDLLPITDPNALTDAWGNKYIYILNEDGKSFSLHSMGPDGRDATPDDIQNDPSFYSATSVSVPAPSAPAPASGSSTP